MRSRRREIVWFYAEVLVQLGKEKMGHCYVSEKSMSRDTKTKHVEGGGQKEGGK